MRPVRLRVRLLVVSRQIGRAGHLWRSSSRSSKPWSRSRSPRRPSRGPHRRIAASCFVAGYRSSPSARASARVPRTGPARLTQLDTRLLVLLLTRFSSGWRTLRRNAPQILRSRAEERPSGWRRETRRRGSPFRRGGTQAGRGGVSADKVTRRGPAGGRRERRRGERGRTRGLGGTAANSLG